MYLKTRYPLHLIPVPIPLHLTVCSLTDRYPELSHDNDPISNDSNSISHDWSQATVPFKSAALESR